MPDFAQDILKLMDVYGGNRDHVDYWANQAKSRGLENFLSSGGFRNMTGQEPLDDPLGMMSAMDLSHIPIGNGQA